MASGEPFSPRQMAEVERAIQIAQDASGLNFVAYVGTLPDGRTSAEEMLRSSERPSSSVLVAVDPDARTVDVVTGRMLSTGCPTTAVDWRSSPCHRASAWVTSPAVCAPVWWCSVSRRCTRECCSPTSPPERHPSRSRLTQRSARCTPSRPSTSMRRTPPGRSSWVSRKVWVRLTVAESITSAG